MFFIDLDFKNKFNRNRSEKVKLLACCFDHSSSTKRFYKGFRMLTLVWSVGHSSVPINFSLLSSKKAQFNGISEEIYKRTSRYKRRVDVLQTAPEQIPESWIPIALSRATNAPFVYCFIFCYQSISSINL
jgi:hypothetical protein